MERWVQVLRLGGHCWAGADECGRRYSFSMILRLSMICHLGLATSSSPSQIGPSSLTAWLSLLVCALLHLIPHSAAPHGWPYEMKIDLPCANSLDRLLRRRSWCQHPALPERRSYRKGQCGVGLAGAMGLESSNGIWDAQWTAEGWCGERLCSH